VEITHQLSYNYCAKPRCDVNHEAARTLVEGSEWTIETRRYSTLIAERLRIDFWPPRSRSRYIGSRNMA
jgi:hypothetical protein